MKIPIALITCLVLVGCAPQEEPQARSETEAVKKAKSAAQAAFQGLSAELAKAMAEGGPTKAIPVCSSKAGSLTSQVAAEQGVTMVRLSDRPRNPDQRAEGDDLTALEAMKSARKSQIDWKQDGAAVVRLPIVLNNPICLNCHGGEQDIAPETRAVLGELYPEDEATGFAMNDLRGMWRIEVPPPSN